MLDETQRHKTMAKKLYELVELGTIDNDWEENFICDVHDQLMNQGRELTPKQAEKLGQLFERH